MKIYNSGNPFFLAPLLKETISSKLPKSHDFLRPHLAELLGWSASTDPHYSTDSQSVMSLPALLFLRLSSTHPHSSVFFLQIILPWWSHSLLWLQPLSLSGTLIILCAWASNIYSSFLQDICSWCPLDSRSTCLKWNKSIPFFLSTLHFPYSLFLVGVTILRPV